MTRPVYVAVSVVALAAAVLTGCSDEPSAPPASDTSTAMESSGVPTTSSAGTPSPSASGAEDLRATAESAAAAGSVAGLEPYITKACALYLRELGGGTLAESTVDDVETTGDSGVVVNVEADGSRTVNKWMRVDGEWRWACDTQTPTFDE